MCVNEVHSLCGVLGLDFGKTVSEIHPSLHGTNPEQSTNISDTTLEGLDETILRLKTERKVRLQKVLLLHKKPGSNFFSYFILELFSFAAERCCCITM